VEYGLDENNNGTLDIAEINAALTKYVFNGVVVLCLAGFPFGRLIHLQVFLSQVDGLYLQEVNK
jgi:hypothetical protein